MDLTRIVAALFAGAAFVVAVPCVSATAADDVPTLLGPDMKKSMDLNPDNMQTKH